MTRRETPALALQIWRCYIIWSRRCWIVAIPCLALLASASEVFMGLYTWNDLLRLLPVSHGLLHYCRGGSASVEPLG